MNSLAMKICRWKLKNFEFCQRKALAMSMHAFKGEACSLLKVFDVRCVEVLGWERRRS